MQRQLLTVASLVTFTALADAQLTGERPALGTNRITQAQIVGGSLTQQQIREKGMQIFSTPFNKLDGYGDGDHDPFNPEKTEPGNRPYLQNNNTFNRINGLDTQACLECHAILSNAKIPARFAVGGVGGTAAVAMPGPRDVDIDDDAGNGFAHYDGRLINPPFLFGSGGVEALAKEMTIDLEALKQAAIANPNVPVPLVAKGVSFGTVSWDGATLDTSGVEGLILDDYDEDGLDDFVVQPFGRKGNNASIRQFDIGALLFHQGMEPEEVVDDNDGDGWPDPGVDNDADGDGHVNEIFVGELSALHIFSTSMEKPRIVPLSTPQISAGKALFGSLGCATCHVPSLDTSSQFLPISFPEDITDPTANVFYTIDLAASAPGFEPASSGRGVKVELFSDLKLHDMGPELAESTGSPLDPFFITPRLWGVADTGPWMHDGRAMTMSEAIMMHGGEGQAAGDAFTNSSDSDKLALLTYLRTLRTPKFPNTGLDSADLVID